MKVCHITSVHKEEDGRIFLKECTSLANNGYETYLIQKGSSYKKNGVNIIGFGVPSTNRLKRMIKDTRLCYKIAVDLNCDIYHIHDPELLPYALKLKRKGKRVIFDSHEDIAGQIYDKPWLPKFSREIISNIYYKYETYIVRQLDAAVAATPHIADTFFKRCNKVITVNNYPKLDDIEYHEPNFTNRERIACFAGEISELRGGKVMMDAMCNLDAKLILAGPFLENKEEINDSVSYLGIIDRKGINDLYGKSRLGLLLYLPAKNHYEAQPNKMFEYMAAGLPCVCSNFPYWREIVEKNNCGLCVDETDYKQVSKAIATIIDDTELLKRMAVNGREAVQDEYNWEKEEKKLIELYSTLEVNDK